MTAFDAATVVEPLDYDLTKYVEGAKGTIPEPPQGSSAAFRRKLISLAPGGDVKRFGELSEDDFKAVSEQSIDALAEFCAGSPTREQMAALPDRVLMKFNGWLFGQFNDIPGSVG